MTGILIGVVLRGIAPEFLYRVAYQESDSDIILMFYLVGIFNHIFYYTICETAFKGKTLGKAVSGTRAIREDGSDLRFKDALLRSLCRLVPFEAFSGFGTPWHDSWTRTAVIKTR